MRSPRSGPRPSTACSRPVRAGQPHSHGRARPRRRDGPVDLPALRPRVRPRASVAHLRARRNGRCGVRRALAAAARGLRRDHGSPGQPGQPCTRMPSRSAVFLKRDRKLAEVRPRSRDVSLALYLPRPVRDPRIAKMYGPGAPRAVHMIFLREPGEVDEQVRGWLTDAFLHASGGPAGEIAAGRRARPRAGAGPGPGPPVTTPRPVSRPRPGRRGRRLAQAPRPDRQQGHRRRRDDDQHQPGGDVTPLAEQQQVAGDRAGGERQDQRQPAGQRARGG